MADNSLTRRRHRNPAPRPKRSAAILSPQLTVLRYLCGYARGDGEYAYAVAAAAVVVDVPLEQIRGWLHDQRTPGRWG